MDSELEEVPDGSWSVVMVRDAVEQFFTSKRQPPARRDVELIARGEKLALASGLAAVSWGSPDHPIVLLAHGWNSRGTHWVSFIEALVSAGFRPITLDAPAHGESPGLQTNAFEYGLLLLEIGRNLGPLAGIVGHSFGAAAIMIALERGLDARRSVLISGPASISALTKRWAIARNIPESVQPIFLDQIVKKVGVRLEDFDMTFLARRMRGSALVVHDRLDKDIPVAEAESLAAAWPDAKILITERYGHNRILVAKEVVQEVVNYLKEA